MKGKPSMKPQRIGDKTKITTLNFSDYTNFLEPLFWGFQIKYVPFIIHKIECYELSG